MSTSFRQLRQRSLLLKNSVEMLSQKMQRCRDILGHVTDDLSELSQQLESIDRQRDFMSSSLQALLDNDVIEQIGLLKEQSPKLPSMTVVTRPIECTRTSDSSVFSIGRIEIVIELRTGGVKLSALDRKHPTLHHPHASIDGRPCFGNASGMLEDLWRKGELASYIGVLVEFLRHANSDDEWGSRIAEWPKVKDAFGNPLNPPVYEINDDDEDYQDPHCEEEY